jgi:arylsulfatase A-like enzyme
MAHGGRRQLVRSALPAGALVACGVAVCGLAACQPRSTTVADSAANARPDVLVLLMDTVRADRLGSYGHSRPTSPALDRLAARSIRFERAWSQSACTFPSVNSILTSRDPHWFLGQPDASFGIPGEFPTMAQILGRQGYRTLAVSASTVVRNSPSEHNPHAGFGAGFEVFDERCQLRRADCVGRVARELLAANPEPVFLYLHYYDSHAPYQPPAATRGSFTPRPFSGRPFVRKGDLKPLSEALYERGEPIALSPVEREHVLARYDEEIAFMDREIGSLLDDLEVSGRLRRALVAVVADHGEEFLEHGHLFHCRTVYDSSTRVPFLLRLPGVAPRSIAEPVENLDLLPTLLDYLQIAPPPAARFEGRSLRAAIEHPAGARRLVYSAQTDFRSVSDGRFKLIANLRERRFVLHDLERDPHEQRDVRDQHRDEFARLRQALLARVERVEGSARPGADAEALRALQAVGYLN